MDYLFDLWALVTFIYNFKEREKEIKVRASLPTRERESKKSSFIMKLERKEVSVFVLVAEKFFTAPFP